jgi:hypothetical protein
MVYRIRTSRSILRVRVAESRTPPNDCRKHEEGPDYKYNYTVDAREVEDA